MAKGISKECFVAHVDIMGFGNIIEKDPKTAWCKIQDLWKCMSQLRRDIKICSSQTLIKDKLRFFIFSDNIVVFTDDSSAESFLSIYILLTALFQKAMTYGIPLRIGISSGQFFADLTRGLFCGPPHVKAYKIGEGSRLIGIVVDDSIRKEYGKHEKFLKTHGGQPSIIPYNIPLHKGTRQGWVVNWPLLCSDNFPIKPVTLDSFYGIFEPLFGPYDEVLPDDKTIYKNTIKFINANIIVNRKVDG